MEARQDFCRPAWLEQYLLPFCCPWQSCVERLAPSHSRGESFLAGILFYLSAKADLTPHRSGPKWELCFLKEDCPEGRDW